MDETETRRSYLELQRDTLLASAYYAHTQVPSAVVAANQGRLDALYRSIKAVNEELASLPPKPAQKGASAILQNYSKSCDAK